MAKKYDQTPFRAQQEDDSDLAGPESLESLSGTERLKKRRRISGDTPDPLPVASRVDIELERWEKLPLVSVDDPMDYFRENSDSPLTSWEKLLPTHSLFQSNWTMSLRFLFIEPHESCFRERIYSILNISISRFVWTLKLNNPVYLLWWPREIHRKDYYWAQQSGDEYHLWTEFPAGDRISDFSSRSASSGDWGRAIGEECPERPRPQGTRLTVTGLTWLVINEIKVTALINNGLNCQMTRHPFPRK